MHTILGPPNHSTFVVGAGGKAVIATGQRIERRHHVVLPNKTQADVARLPAEESRTTPRLSVGFRGVGLRDAGDDAAVVFYWPRHVAVLVRSTECSEIKN